MGGNGWQRNGCPMEEMTERWLLTNGIRYRRDDQTAEGTQLDFYLIDFDVYLEVKQFHSDRIAAQMARASNVIAVQGIDSLTFLGALVSRANVEPLTENEMASTPRGIL